MLIELFWQVIVVVNKWEAITCRTSSKSWRKKKRESDVLSVSLERPDVNNYLWSSTISFTTVLYKRFYYSALAGKLVPVFEMRKLWNAIVELYEIIIGWRNMLFT